jgi:hypothetical protein
LPAASPIGIAIDGIDRLAGDGVSYHCPQLDVRNEV